MKSVLIFVALAVAVTAAAAAAQAPPLTPTWSVKLTGTPSPTPLSAIAGTTYFVNDINGTVWAVDLTTRKVTWSLHWDDLSSIIAYPEQDVLLALVFGGTWAVRASTGALLWANNTVQFTTYTQIGQWIVGTTANAAGVATLACFDAQTGRVHWSVPVGNSYISAQYASGNTLLIQNGTSTISFDAATGVVLWSKPGLQILGVGHGLVVAAKPSNTSSYNTDVLFVDAPTGNVKAELQNFVNASSPAIAFDPNGNIVITDTPYYVKAISSVSFAVVWMTDLIKVPALHSGIASMVVGPTAIIAVSNPLWLSQNQLFNLTSFSRDDGHVKWTVVDPPTNPEHDVDIIGKYVFVPNVIGYIAFAESTGDVAYKSYSEAMPIAVGSQQPYGANGIVAQLPDGSVAAFNF